jgi:NADH-quinone oxidoreductase subunit M
MGIGLLTAVVFLPTLAGVLVLLFPERAARVTALVGSAVVLALALWLYIGLITAPHVNFGNVLQPQWAEHAPWIDLTLGSFHFRVDYALGTDGLSLPMIVLNALLTMLAVIGSWHIESRIKLYMALMLFLETSVMGVFASFDLFLFFLFWEIELIPMFLLIGIWGGARREYAAWKFLLFTLIGSAFTLAGIFMLYVQTGAKSALFGYLAQATAQVQGSLPFFGTTVSLALIVFLLLYTGFAVKIPMWPVHTWLPDAHTEAPTAVSVLLAGVLLKMGAYGLIRVCLSFAPAGAQAFAPWLGVLAAINVLWGAGASMVQRDMKRMIAYSSVSHMGYVLLGVAAAAAVGTASVNFRSTALTGATLQMFTHGTITGMLFFCVGVLYDKAHTREIDGFGGIAKRMPLLATLFSLACFASLGLPALSGFVAEFLVFTGSFASLPGLTIAAVFGVVLTAGYLLWMLKRSFYGPLNLKWSWLTDANNLAQIVPMTTLAVVILLVGIYPKPLVDLIKPSVQQILTTVQAVTPR